MSTDPAPSSPAAPPPEIPSTTDERTLAMLCHLGGGFLSIVVPLIIWAIKKDQSRFIDDQGKEAVNFQILVLIAMIASALTCFIAIGVVLVPAVYVANIVLSIIAGMAANQGQVYRYPFGIRLIK